MSTLTMNQIMNINGIENNERIILNTISFLSKKEGYCWAGVPKLAELSKVSERTVQRLVKKMVEKKILLEETIYGNHEKHIVGRKLTIIYKPNSNTKKNEAPEQEPEQPNNEQPNQEQESNPNNEQSNQGESNQDQQPETPVNPFEVGIPDEQKLEDKPCLDFINHEKFVERFGNPSQTIIDLEKAYSIYEFNTVLAGSLNTDVRKVEAYFADSLKKNRNKLNQYMHNMKSGANVVREEQVPDWLKAQQENGDGWDKVHAQEKSKQFVSDKECKTMDDLKMLQADYLKNKSNGGIL